MARAGHVILAVSLLTLNCGVSKPVGPPDGAGGRAGGNAGGNGSGAAGGGAGGQAGATPSTHGGTSGAGGASPGAGGSSPSGTNGWTMPTDGLTFSCGPSGAGLLCSCGNSPYFPAPPGSNVTFIPAPDTQAGPGYRSQEEFDALAVGRWVRTAGAGELSCEQYGLDFTSDHLIVPLVVASDGSIQQVWASRVSFTIDFTRWATPALVVNGGGLTTNAPLFTSGPETFYFVYSPWPALYTRVR